MTNRPSSLVIGWEARSERSMIESRRCPRPQRRSMLHQTPDPSGPRERIASRVLSSSVSCGGLEAEWYAKMPFIPHIRRDLDGPEQNKYRKIEAHQESVAFGQATALSHTVSL